jgi:hypothetical protein
LLCPFNWRGDAHQQNAEISVPMPTSAKQARSASFVLAYELETVRCNRERELDRIELAASIFVSGTDP